ncbi:uncharacterized protein LOC129765269 [Toxorhynchites rutilus septentrionalis]|uniref:uncharacterized protein LOC129765269 n=1 Tax=Toxorhynchites rutilus septentrionalis TaxID=329112 RepID=UPI002479AC0A|nr:uncharacterized protein LOC129765269 [Toxorhynchites rutilus septentrionalis]XP_055621371.1 uncharacterized protein LOC129765269 [Toxorhynchites rutilus septentrionalis]
MDNLCENRQELPKRLREKLIFHKRVVIGRNNVVYAVITSELQLFEVKQQSIVSSLALAEFLPADVETDEKVDLCVYRSNDGIGKKILYLIQINRNLVVVERKDHESRKFCHRQTFERFVRHDVTEKDDRPGYTVVNIYTEDQPEPTVTDFQSYRIEPTKSSVDNFTCFDDILKTLKEQNDEKRAQLATLRLTTGELFEQQGNRLKQVSLLLRTENPYEKQPLVKYGDAWIKVHNELIVVGFPVFNCTDTRQLTLTNLQLLLINRNKTLFDYSYKFYQLRDDDFNFKNYEEILQAEETVSTVPLFRQEWEQTQNNALHPEESGIFMATMKLSVLSSLELSTTLACFVTYDVANGEKNFCGRLQLYLGPVEIKRTNLYSRSTTIDFTGADIFKDLLVMTATSEHLCFEISFKKQPTTGIDRFFVDVLKFKLVDLGFKVDAQESPRILYNGDNGYLQATLIRLDELQSTKQKMKIYCRHQHQILTLLQAIYSDYEEDCSIALYEDRNTTLLELKDSLLKELAMKIEQPTNVEEIIAREMATDCIFSKLAID